MPVSKTEWTANRIQHYPDTRESLYLQSLCLRTEVSKTEWTADRIQHYPDTRESPANSLCLRRVNSQNVLSEWTLKVSFQSELSKGPFWVNSQSVLSEWTLKKVLSERTLKVSFQSEPSKGPFWVNSQSVLSEWTLKVSFQSKPSKCPFRVNSQNVLYTTRIMHQASPSGTFLQTLPVLVMPLEGHSLSDQFIITLHLTTSSFEENTKKCNYLFII